MDRDVLMEWVDMCREDHASNQGTSCGVSNHWFLKASLLQGLGFRHRCVPVADRMVRCIATDNSEGVGIQGIQINNSH